MLLVLAKGPRNGIWNQRQDRENFHGTHVSSRKMEYWQPKTKDIFVAAGAKVVFSRQGNENLFPDKVKSQQPYDNFQVWNSYFIIHTA